MIVLDTNIISELMKPVPDANVVAWLDAQETTHLFVTTISIAKINYGLSILPKGKKREQLEGAFIGALEDAFDRRILSFDKSAAFTYGKLMESRKSLGRPLSILDGQIAAITHSSKASIATRNVRDFEYCEIAIVNPFEDFSD